MFGTCRKRPGRRARIRLISFALAAIAALGLFSASCWGRLQAWQRRADIGAARAFAETAEAVEQLSAALEKSLYAADGGMCARVCAEICADAGRAGTAMAALPFSTVEMEKVRGFLGRTGDYARCLCREAAEGGFTDEQRQNLAALADTAGQLAEALGGMRGDLCDGVLTMDRLEKAAANVLDGEPAFLSARMGDCEKDFPEARPLRYAGRFSSREEKEAEPADERRARELAAPLLGCAPEEAELCPYEDGAKLLLTKNGRAALVSAAGLESLRDERLVSEVRLSEEEARQKAGQTLAELGFEGLTLSESRQSGALLWLRYAAGSDGVTALDRTLTVAVALDDGSIHALDCCHDEAAAGEGDWALSEEEAKSLLPAGLRLTELRRVTLAGEDGESLPCYELLAEGERGPVRLYFDARSGRQQEIVIG
ncbi:MAG: germination protein YpeB [Oscillospiraceae bacterium]|nr:germination protein YpeB [Oscillospiraceae bacterium]